MGTPARVQKGCEAAIETALGAAAQNLVVDGEASAKAAIAFLKQEKAGRATFLPLDTVQPSHLDASRLPQGRSGLSLVEYDPRYEKRGVEPVGAHSGGGGPGRCQPGGRQMGLPATAL